jgi:hypothetical protein
LKICKDCIGPALPTARVTYPKSTAFCDGNAAATLIRHVTTLGVVCNLTSGQVLIHNDYYFECAELNDQFNIEDKGDFGLQENQYVCGRSATFPAGSLETNMQAISSAAIVTDDFWLTETETGCFHFNRASSNPSLPTPPAAPPVTDTPTPPFPTPGFSADSPTAGKLPTPSPIKETTAPTKKPTSTPPTPVDGQSPIKETTAPTKKPTSTPPAPVDGPVGNAGAIAGGTIAGIAIVASVAFFLVRKHVQSDNSQHKPPGSRVGASAPQTHTEANTVVAIPYSAPSIRLATDVVSAQAPTQSSPNRTSYSSTPLSSAGSYDVQFKDQARSVLGTSQSSVPMVVPGVPMTEAIPIAVALDGSAASGGSKNTIRSEPPGRRADP